MVKRGFLTGLIQGKCPRCREGDIFAYPISRITKFNVMNDTCPHCGIKLEPEPGYYQGAMFVSYAYAVILIGIISAILYFFFGNPSEWTYITACSIAILAIVPLNYRYSRILFLYLFGGPRYKPGALE
jgi:uncharacterized protein (DUF983 family)